MSEALLLEMIMENRWQKVEGSVSINLDTNAFGSVMVDGEEIANSVMEIKMIPGEGVFVKSPWLVGTDQFKRQRR